MVAQIRVPLTYTRKLLKCRPFLSRLHSRILSKLRAPPVTDNAVEPWFNLFVMIQSEKTTTTPSVQEEDRTLRND